MLTDSGNSLIVRLYTVVTRRETVHATLYPVRTTRIDDGGMAIVRSTEELAVLRGSFNGGLGVLCATLAQALEAQGIGADFILAQCSDANAARAICLTVTVPVYLICSQADAQKRVYAGCGMAGLAFETAFNGMRDYAVAMLASKPVEHRAVICDLDGLLLDSLWIWHELDETFLKKYNMFTLENLRAMQNSGTLEEAAGKLRAVGLDMTDDEFAAEFKGMLAHAYRYELQLFPGAREFLEQRKAAGFKLALVTASPSELVEPALKRLGLDRIFDDIFYGVDKHTPFIFYDVLEHFGTSIAETPVYDDLPRIQRMAIAAGFTVFGSIDATLPVKA